MKSAPTPKRLAIKLKPAAERMVKKGHPWIFEDSIVKQSQEGAAGDLAIIYDHKKNKFLACGFYDPHSVIRIKLLQFRQAATIDATWFAKKLQAAYERRTSLLATATNSYRLVYGENDGLPSLIVDVYAEVMVIKLYSSIWLPYLELLQALLLDLSACKTVVLRLSRQVQQQKFSSDFQHLEDGICLYGNLEQEVVFFKEHGINFSANVIKGHKTGYFLDHRHNRLKVGHLAKNKRMLDIFSYAGGFSVHALARGAKEVWSLDISKKALEVAQQNAQLNAHQGQHHTLAMDAFEGLQQLIRTKEQFDIVVIDPPSFAKQAKELAGAKSSYQRLVQLGIQLVAPNGLLVMASCTARLPAADFFDLVEQTLKQSGRPFSIQEKTYHDSDHPIGFPEGAYLKCGYYQLD